MARTRRDLEIVYAFRAQPLVASSPNVLNSNWPLGEGWYRMNLRLGILLVVGTGTTPIAEGELNIIKGVTLKTSAGETLVDLPGRALYKIAAALNGTLPRKDAIAAASAQYYVDLPIFFVDDLMKRPEDTILDTSRYTGLNLVVTLGGVADLLGTVGTATATYTLDVEIERTKGKLPPQALPIFHRYYGASGAADASVQTYVEIDRAPDIAYKRFFAHGSSAGVSGGIFTGANADDVQNLESIKDQSGAIVLERIHEMVQNQNKLDYSLESVLAGITIFDFVRDGSINSALYPGDRSRLRYEWTNKTVQANDIVSLAFDAVRGLKQ